jgi:nucleoside-diphosphate-sugar epimerase
MESADEETVPSMHIAITGSSGRVGRGVVELALSLGHSIVSIDRVSAEPSTLAPGITAIEADITDYAALEHALSGCDALIHLAAIPTPGGQPNHVVHNNNVVSSYNALSAAAHLGITRVCQASSVNAIGAAFSRWPRYDYFPLDEQHPTYAEDPYSLSKWICEQQADAIVRRYESMKIASLRFHWVLPDRATAVQINSSLDGISPRHLWGYARLHAAARACMLALTANFSGHETFYIVAPDTTMELPSLELAQRFFPTVPVRGDLSGNRSFFSCEKADRLLGWKHNEK